MNGMTSGRAALAALTLAAIIGTSAAVSAVRPHAKSAATPAAARGQLVAFGGRSVAQQRSGTGAKFDAALADLARRSGSVDATTAAVNLRSLNPAARFMVSHTTGKAYVAVDAITRGDPQALKAALLKLGLQQPAVYLNDVGGWLPLQSLEAAAALTQVHSIRAALSRTHAVAVYVIPDLAAGPIANASYVLVLEGGALHAGTSDRRGAVFDPVAPEGDLTLLRANGTSGK